MKMKPILIVKIVLDFVMIVLFLLLMSYHLLPNATHEWIGASVFVLFIVHNVLNFRWYKNLFRGKYTINRIIDTIINFILWIAMIGCIISAMIISGHVFAFLNLSAARLGRALHLASTVWAFILTSIHFGIHLKMFIVMAKKIANPSEKSALIIKWISRAFTLAICAFGAYIFITRRLWEEMFLLTEFKWFDFDKNILVYIIENISLLTMFTAIGYYGKKIIIKSSRRTSKGEI